MNLPDIVEKVSVLLHWSRTVGMFEVFDSTVTLGGTVVRVTAKPVGDHTLYTIGVDLPHDTPYETDQNLMKLEHWMNTFAQTEIPVNYPHASYKVEGWKDGAQLTIGVGVTA